MYVTTRINLKKILVSEGVVKFNIVSEYDFIYMKYPEKANF